VAIPSLLAVSAMHQYLIKTKRRTSVSLILEAGQEQTPPTITGSKYKANFFDSFLTLSCDDLNYIQGITEIKVNDAVWENKTSTSLIWYAKAYYPDPEYKDEDVIYEVTRSDIRILKQIHSLGDEQYKRLMAYMKALQKLEQMENMVEE